VADEYFTYVQTYIAVRHALEGNDVGDLARIELLVQQHRLETVRQAGSLGITDARARVPMRSQEHLYRLLGAEDHLQGRPERTMDLHGDDGADVDGGGERGVDRGSLISPWVLNETLKAWTFDRAVAPDVAARMALDRLEVADLEVVLLSTHGDVIAVQVVEGGMSDPDDVLYVAGRGLYEVVRTEVWPPATAGGSSRTLLTLKAWPSA